MNNREFLKLSGAAALAAGIPCPAARAALADELEVTTTDEDGTRLFSKLSRSIDEPFGQVAET